MSLAIVTSRTQQRYNRKPPWPYSVNWNSPQAQGLVAWYPDDPAGGGTLFDLVRGTNGIISGATWTPTSGEGLGLSFDGNDDVNLGTSSIFDPSGGLSFSCRFLWDGTAYTANGIYIVGDFNSDAGACSFAIRVSTGSPRLEFFLQASGGNQAAGGTIQANTVYQLTATWNGSNSKKLYLNGVEVGSNSFPQSPSGPVANVRIGRPGDYNGLYWTGKIWDVRWNRGAMSPATASAIYNPATRWDLYQVLGQRTWFLPQTTPQSQSAFNAAYALNSNRMLGGGIC